MALGSDSIAVPEPAQAGSVGGEPHPSDIVVGMRNVRFTWPGRNAFTIKVRSVAVPARTRLLLVGPSGSGKSTFLSLLAGVTRPQSGALHVLGTELSALSSAARDRFRAEHIGIIFQMFNLLPYGSVLDNVVLPLSFSTRRRQRATASGPAEQEALRLLASLGLDADELAGLPAASLSVGQQQRVAAARALIGRPELIVADEPTSALDRDRQAAFLDLLFGEVEAAGATLIMVSHDEDLGRRFDQVLRLDEIVETEREGRSP